MKFQATLDRQRWETANLIITADSYDEARMKIDALALSEEDIEALEWNQDSIAGAFEITSIEDI